MGFNLSYSTIFKFLNSENMDGEWCNDQDMPKVKFLAKTSWFSFINGLKMETADNAIV